jgi:ketosteroid isomerase-like protein
MKTTDVPRPISELVDATNRADSEAFLATFTEDALLDDWGRRYRGREEIRDWDRTDNIGVQSHMGIVKAESGTATGTYSVAMAVAGNGFNGTGSMLFTVRGDLIASLVIS